MNYLNTVRVRQSDNLRAIYYTLVSLDKKHILGSETFNYSVEFDDSDMIESIRLVKNTMNGFFTMAGLQTLVELCKENQCLFFISDNVITIH